MTSNLGQVRKDGYSRHKHGDVMMYRPVAAGTRIVVGLLVLVKLEIFYLDLVVVHRHFYIF